MSIRFACEKCGHAFEVDDQAAGKHGRCRRCGHRLVVPETEDQASGGLRLKPVDDAPERSPAHLLESPPPLTMRAGEAQEGAWPSAVSKETPGGDALRRQGPHHYAVGWPFDGQTRKSSGPPPLWWNLPSLTARFVARWLRRTRDLLYYISLAALLLILYGFLFKVKALLHVGAVVVLAGNISMFCVGVAYLVTLPFKDSLRHGLACLLVPFYAIYYWATRWHRMRHAVLNTLAAFIPMFLVALAYFLYKEAPVIEAEAERAVTKVEDEAEKLRKDLETLDK